VKIISNNPLTNTAQYGKSPMSFDNTTMKTTITIEANSPEEAAEILARLFTSGASAAVAVEAAPKKKTAKKAPVVEEVEVVESRTEAEVTAKATELVVEEVEVVESRTEAEVTAKAKELVVAASPTVLRGVLDSIIGAGVKISGAPKDSYDALYDAIDAMLADLNDV
jgi:hypothetical protein